MTRLSPKATMSLIKLVSLLLRREPESVLEVWTSDDFQATGPGINLMWAGGGNPYYAFSLCGDCQQMEVRDPWNNFSGIYCGTVDEGIELNR